MASVHKYNNKDFYRHCTKNMLYRRHLKSGELVLRKWLIYSPSCCNLFCFTCKLFDLDTNHCSFAKEGFRDWKHADRALTTHENSEMHRQSLLRYLQRKNVEGRIDTNAVKQFRDELNYWHQVLNRILDVIRILSVRGLAFRGDNEHFGSHQNGNYLGILKLIAKYD